MAVCIDTDIFIDLLRGVSPAEKLVQKLLVNNEPVYFSAITEAELLSGQVCRNKLRREQLLHFLSQFTKIPVTNPIAQTGGQFRREYGISISDALIAGTAFHSGAILYSRNVKDFKRLKEIQFEQPYK